MLGCLLLVTVCIVAALQRRSPPPAFLALSLSGVAYSLRRYIRSGTQWAEIERRCSYFERGILRLTNRWQGKGRSGEEFSRDRHLYAKELNVLGNGSLFELLCTTRSEFGAERLAAYLLDDVTMEESRLRHEAVKELREANNLREEIDLLGDYRSQDCGVGAFEGWLSLPPIIFPPAVRGLLLLSSSTSLVFGIGIWAHALSWSQWLPVVLVLIALQTAVAAFYFRRVHPRLRQLRLLTNAFTILQQGLQVLEQQKFNSPKLREIVDAFRSQEASGHLRKLERLVRLFDQREKPQFQYLSYLLAVGTQLVLAVDGWRAKHQHHFREWVDAWAEFEALQSIANYAFEQPGVVFPELVDGDPTFEAAQLGHPLLDSEHCVCNDIVLNAQSRLYLITGSNMAGKSTMLRTIGLNAVIAAAGGPVRAVRARLSQLSICASLAITDSLLEGKSKFLAELARISESIALVRAGKPVLFLIDEILSGTNSSDRKAAAETAVRILLAGGALGAISSHDLELSKIARDPALGAVLVYMESEDPGDPLAFDYLLKPGVSNNSSALAIVRMIGISDLPVLIEAETQQ
jgi:MutS domain V